MPAARETDVGVDAAGGAFGADIEHVDDAPPFARLHARPDQSAEPDRREQFQIEVFLPDFVGDRFERHRARCSGIVDEHVDPAEIGDHLLVGVGDVRGPGDVANVVANLEIILGQPLPRRLQIRWAPREDRDLGAGLGEPARHRDADPLAAAGDDGDAILHGYVHSFLPWLLRTAPWQARSRPFANSRGARG
jgi:hypothetical protein